MRRNFVEENVLFKVELGKDTRRAVRCTLCNEHCKVLKQYTVQLLLLLLKYQELVLTKYTDHDDSRNEVVADTTLGHFFNPS